MIWSRAFWLGIARALLRTAMAALVPFIPGLIADPASVWLVATLTIGLTLVVAVASSLSGLPDASGPWWQVALQRAARQFGQFIAAATASAVLLTDIDWRTVLLAAAASALSTFVLAALTLTASPTDWGDQIPVPMGAVIIDGDPPAVVVGTIPASAEYNPLHD